MVESGYLEIQYDIPNRGATGISAVNRGAGAQRACGAAPVGSGSSFIELRADGRSLDSGIRRLYFIQLAVRSQGIF